jgi:hypothetical protein
MGRSHSRKRSAILALPQLELRSHRLMPHRTTYTVCKPTMPASAERLQSGLASKVRLVQGNLLPAEFVLTLIQF